MEIINSEEKEMTPLTNKEIKSYEEQKVCHICKRKFCHDKNKSNMTFITKSEIIATTLENLEGMLIIFAIYNTK